MTDRDQEPVRLPGARDCPGTLDVAAESADACVVACPPHPQLGGTRSDRRLTATSDALATHGIDCLRFDYGNWDDGYGEREDGRNALRWTAERYDAVGIYGYSFGGAIAILAAATVDVPVRAVSVLAPASHLGDSSTDSDASTDSRDASDADPLDAAAAVPALPCPLHVGYGERDETADASGIVDAAERCGQSVTAYAADHHFVGQHDAAGRDAAAFLATHLDADG